MTLGTFPGRENVDAKEAQRKATYVYVCMTRGRDYSSVQNVASIWASMGGRGSAFGGSRGSNSEGPYGHQKPPQKWTPGRPKSGPPAAHGGQNGVHILDAKMAPPIHFIKAGGPKNGRKKSLFSCRFQKLGQPLCYILRRTLFGSGAISCTRRRRPVTGLCESTWTRQRFACCQGRGRDWYLLRLGGCAKPLALLLDTPPGSRCARCSF